MNIPKCFIIDVDGVMTTGEMLYNADGKTFKIFGPDDHDALILLKPFIDVKFISADHRGYNISKARIVDDMDMSLQIAPSRGRAEWISKILPLNNVIYMGDGIFDGDVFNKVNYSIAPADAYHSTKKLANFVTTSNGGRRAVAEACIHILEKFFSFEPLKTDYNKS